MLLEHKNYPNPDSSYLVPDSWQPFGESFLEAFRFLKAGLSLSKKLRYGLFCNF